MLKQPVPTLITAFALGLTTFYFAYLFIGGNYGAVSLAAVVKYRLTETDICTNVLGLQATIPTNHHREGNICTQTNQPVFLNDDIYRKFSDGGSSYKTEIAVNANTFSSLNSKEEANLLALLALEQANEGISDPSIIAQLQTRFSNLTDLLARIIPGLPEEKIPQIPEVAQGSDPELNRLNNQVIAMLKAGNTERLEEVLIERGGVLLPKIRENPATLVGHALPSEIRENIPSHLQRYVENTVRVTGKFGSGSIGEAFHQSEPNNPPPIIPDALIGNGSENIYELYFESEKPDILKEGVLATFEGYKFDSLFVVTEDEVSTPQVLGVYTDENGEPLSYPQAVGSKSGILIAARWDDYTGDDPISITELNDEVLPQVEEFFSEQSGGIYEPDITASGWFTIPEGMFDEVLDIDNDVRYSCTRSDIERWVASAKEAYRAQFGTGISYLSSHYPVIILFPEHPDCTSVYNFTARGIPGAETYLNGIHGDTEEFAQTITHEIGHNHGALHSQVAICPESYFNSQGGDGKCQREGILDAELNLRTLNNDNPSFLSYGDWSADNVNAVDADRFGWIVNANEFGQTSGSEKVFGMLVRIVYFVEGYTLIWF